MFSVGSLVQVRTKEEILQTLDSEGSLDGMPFMPEMFQYVGKTFQVHKRAHKTCDYSTSYPFRTWRLRKTVHLETRCDGSGHDGCQAGCLLYWKEEWLKSVDAAETSSPAIATTPAEGEELVWNSTVVVEPDGSRRYRCQATEIPRATTPLAWWDVRQYIEDYWSGNVGIGRVISALLYSVCYELSEAGVGIGRPMRAAYNRLHRLWRGPKWPRTPGVLPEGSSTPAASLNLQPGEWVRVKPHDAILQTVTAANLNRGMRWDAEMAPYCEGVFQVAKRVDRIIDEKSGRMLEMKTPCIVLDAVVCQARYSEYRKLCPRSLYPFWREIWLDRVTSSSNPPRTT